MSIRNLTIAGCVLTSACTHVGANRLLLERALMLEAALDSTELKKGTPVRARFLLRNVSDVPVEFCQEDGGVTTFIMFEHGVFPGVGHSTVLDAPCFKRGKLQPGEAREFVEEFTVLPGPGSAQIRGLIRVHSVDDKDNGTIWAQPVAITIREPWPRPHRPRERSPREAVRQ